MDQESYRLIVEAILVPIAIQAVSVLSSLKKSVEELNVKIAVIVNRVDSHEHRIGKLEEK